MVTISSDFKNFPIAVALVVVGYVAVKGIDGLLKRLSKGDILNSEDHVETGDDSELVIGFADGSSIAMPANAEALLDSEVFDPGEVREMHSHNAAL